VLVSVSSFLALPACSVDDRELQQAADSSGGSGAEPSSPAGAAGRGGADSRGGAPATNDAGTTASTAAGASGEANRPSIPTVDGCPDLDTNGIADCKETEITNPDFEQDIAGWNADTGATLTWAAADALSSTESGSALLAASGAVDAPGSSLVSASQCVPVGSNQVVIVYANAFVDADQDNAGQASVYVSFFDDAHCSGASSGGFNTPAPLDAETGVWLTVQAGSLTSAGTASALVKLAIQKPYRAAAFQARFDNILLKQRPAE